MLHYVSVFFTTNRLNEKHAQLVSAGKRLTATNENSRKGDFYERLPLFCLSLAKKRSRAALYVRFYALSTIPGESEIRNLLSYTMLLHNNSLFCIWIIVRYQRACVDENLKKSESKLSEDNSSFNTIINFIHVQCLEYYSENVGICTYIEIYKDLHIWRILHLSNAATNAKTCLEKKKLKLSYKKRE